MSAAHTHHPAGAELPAGVRLVTVNHWTGAELGIEPEVRLLCAACEAEAVGDAELVLEVQDERRDPQAWCDECLEREHEEALS